MAQQALMAARCCCCLAVSARCSATLTPMATLDKLCTSQDLAIPMAVLHVVSNAHGRQDLPRGLQRAGFHGDGPLLKALRMLEFSPG